MSELETEYDIIVIGYGPSGVTAANFLGAAGIRTLVVERETSVYPRARAVTVDDFTLRLFQWVGLDEQLEADMDADATLRWKTYAGREFLRIVQRPSVYGHSASSMIYQPALEATLRRGAERYSEHVDVVFGARAEGIEQDDDGVTVTVVDDDRVSPRRVRARYLLACDGGGSTTRRVLNVKLTGKSLQQTWVIIDAKVKRWWPERNLLTFWSDPRRPVVDIPLALDHHRWELPLREGETRESLQSKESLWELLTPLGVSPDNVEILRHAFYEHHILRAEQWRLGRVFLVGDAAHMMPPWAGQGMQSGMRDAQNLAWKLAAVLSGIAPEGLLDTYQAEREPHVVTMTALAQRMGEMIGARNPVAVALRNNALPLLGRIPGMSDQIARRPAPRVMGGFLSGTPTRRNALGRMIPQPDVATPDGRRVLLDHALPEGMVALGLDVDPAAVMTPADRAGWEQLGTSFVTLRSMRQAPVGETDIVDFRDVLRPWLKRYHARVVVLRPDRFIAACDGVGLSVPEMSGRLTAPMVRPVAAHL